jgi:4-nitrophenyl phosphatase
MRKLIDDLENIKLAIFDLDGVIYRGETLISNANEVIQNLKDLSIKVVYNSNNSTATRQMYVDRLKKFEIMTEIDDFYTSASISAFEITKIKKNANIYVIGEKGLKEELKMRGHKIIEDPSNYNEIDFVIVGLHRNLTYKDLAIAQKCILEGNAQFYATNTDPTLPASRGLLPGAGVMVKAIETCTSRKPSKIFGKPSPLGINLILEETNIPPKNAVIFGDRIETDILAGNRAGIKTIVVLTGVTTKDMISDIKNKAKSLADFEVNLIPNLVINSLDEIFIN